MKDLRSHDTLIQLGWVVSLAVLVPLFLGVLLDRQLSTSPLFILVGGMSGALAATVGIVRVTARAIDGFGATTKMPSGEMNRQEGQE
jgi:F0F1-type ATP synthase assembly protein I